ncbi:MAG: DUF423 domain-containing protein [Dokdonella sp.]
MTSTRFSLLAGAIAGAVAVALGAFGAHALRSALDERALATWHTAVDYQFWHALALLAVGLLTRATSTGESSTRASKIAAVAFVVGIALFCGSLYALALGAPHIVGVITPLGGVALIAGWLALAVHAVRDAARQ